MRVQDGLCVLGELSFLLFLNCILDLGYGECDACLTVFANCLVKHVGGGALLDRPCMVFQRMCVLCL